MKVLHLCLASFFIDDFSYQENILPKFHKKSGHEVEIIASLVSFDQNGKPCLLKEANTYVNEYGILVKRLNYKKGHFNKKIRKYDNTFESIKDANPDIIFVHGCQFLDIKYVKKYAELNANVKIYVDNHADFSNSAKNFLSKNVVHKVIWRHCAHLIEPFTTKFYGVLPARVDFLKKIYKLPCEKIELLVMGADDDKVEEAKNIDVRKEIREHYNIKQDDFLIVTGGKIDHAKIQTLLLMEAVKKIENENIRLIVFGSIINELKEKINELVDGIKIQYIGWVNSEDSYKYFAASDLAVFPGRHSVFWEQVVGLGIPMVVKHWEGTTHVDLGGNCKFLYNDSVDEIFELLMSLINDKGALDIMRKIAESKGMKYFSYKDISSRAIEV